MVARTGRGELERSVVVAPEVTVTWDPARPHRCMDFAIAHGDADARLAGVERGPWLRVAAIGVLDRCLYLPLDRSLLDAELATTQLAAARTLRPTEPAREVLIGKALVGARRASRGVVAFVDCLVAEDGRPPPALAAPLGMLARGYAALAGEVHEFDAALAAVTTTWRKLALVERAAARRPRVVEPLAPGPSRSGAAQIDPRAVPARVLRLGPTPDAAEISVDPVERGGGAAVRVRVDAFSTRPTLDEGIDVGVRLIDRRSGEIRGYGVLGRPTTPRPRPHFEGVFTLPETMSAHDVRVDLFGPAPRQVTVPDGCADLQRARRAILFMAAWRALVADVRLWGSRIAPAARLRTIIEQLGDDHPAGSGEPLWPGGPSRSDLSFLAESGDRTLTAWLRRASGRNTAVPRREGAAVVVAAVSGPGDLLVAEVAAAYERSQED